ncbi:MAG: hypothetical protein JHC34_01310, partial [Acidobacteria bacterium]|nr:hypothetical protein [Acidobacteriota bacterium]
MVAGKFRVACAVLLCALFPLAFSAALPATALTRGAKAFAWGDDFYGQLGDGKFGYSAIPVQVLGLTGVIRLSGGLEHSLALRSDGTLWAWGNNTFGQLGNGNTSQSLVPVRVSGLMGAVTAIAAGEAHSLALQSDGTVWAWGANNYGQLGEGTKISSKVAVPAPRLSG